MNLPGRSVDRAVTARLKAVVRDELHLGDEAVVVISELRCGDGGCAPVETLIAVLQDGCRRVWRVPCPTAEFAPQALRTLLTEHPDGGRT